MVSVTSILDVPSPAPVLAVSKLACTDHDVEHACRYQVAWSINPHMSIGAVEYHAAAAQHGAFLAALAAEGANLIELPFVHGAYDSVFAKDSALLIERCGTRRALLARMRHPERQREQQARRDCYARHGFEVVYEPGAPSWEGGDAMVQPSGCGMFLGYGPRSHRAAAAWLERHAGMAVTPLELSDPYLYHLDMALAVLLDGTAIVCETALTDEAMTALERARGIREIVTVPREDALAFGLNLVPVGTTLISGACVPRIAAIVGARGYRYRVAPLDQFHLAGGSAGCLIARLHRDAEPVGESSPPTSTRGSDRATSTAATRRRPARRGLEG